MNDYELFKSILTTIPEDSRNVSLIGFAVLMVISIVMALLVAKLYVKFFDTNSTGSKIHRSFPLIGPAVTTIFITVQFSLPLSLGLLGALSIVRFRTPIKEPEEIGFILLVIACSISIATFNVAFAALLYLAALGVLYLLKFVPLLGNDHADSVVLNVIVNNPDALSPMKQADEISRKLNEHGIKHIVSSIHMDEQRTNVSIALKNHKDNNFHFLENLYRDDPHLQVDYYRR